MYLSHINLTHFRSFRNSVVHFDKDITALVGENNSGKSNVIEALRLLTPPLSDRRDRYCEANDVRIGTPLPHEFTLKACYAGLSQGQKGLLLAGVADIAIDEAEFGLTYKAPTKALQRGEVKYWAGAHAAEPEQGSTDLVRHVYLPPLRDAQRVLASGNATRILSLLRHFLGGEADEVLLAQALRRPAAHRTITDINTNVGGFLTQLTAGVRPQTASLGFSEDETLFGIARDLRFKLADDGIPPEDLVHSGLGFANLLFMATIVVELEKASDADLTLFLVEEPEAHLHPQLQASVLSFLHEKAESSRSREKQVGKPEGHVQVIVSTHSPNMASGVPPSHITVIRSIPVAQQPRRESVAIPVSKLEVDAKELAKIDRYIDTTKSSILFGQRCLLVEGIAEAIILPVIAKLYVFNGANDADKANLRKFRCTALIPIEGVDFEPYVNVLLKRYKEHCICDRVVVVTDRDPNVLGNRRERLLACARDHGSADNIRVHVNQQTLESELYTAENHEILKSTYLTLHPRSEEKWNEFMEGNAAERPDQFVQLLKDSKTKKGDFAQTLAAHILETFDPEAEVDYTFTPPQYLIDAIRDCVA